MAQSRWKHRLERGVKQINHYRLGGLNSSTQTCWSLASHEENSWIDSSDKRMISLHVAATSTDKYGRRNVSGSRSMAFAIVWDIETVPDRDGFAPATGLTDKSGSENRRVPW
jgi:hypothetical protein